MGKRTDIHRPSAFDPADYRVIDYVDVKRPEPPPTGNAAILAVYSEAVKRWEARIFEHFPGWRTGGGDHKSVFVCNHCGHNPIRYVAVVEHIPTGDRLAFGEICADRVELSGRDEFKRKYARDRAAEELRRYERDLASAEWRAANEGLAAWLDSLSSDHDSDTHPFLLDMKRALGRYGSLTENQTTAVGKWFANELRRRERFAAEREKLAANGTGPLVEGRRVIEGEILSVKWKHSQYGGSYKATIREDDGNKVWGTLPRALEDGTGDYWLARPSMPGPDADVLWESEDGAMIRGEGPESLRGRRVRLTATVVRSDRDEHFGFYNKPTGAELLS